MQIPAEAILSVEDVFVDFAAPAKARLLEDLSGRAAARLGLEPSAVTAEILAREALGSTGVGKGVAIPHARLAGLVQPFAMLARLRRGIEFDAIDGEPVDVVILVLLPADQEAGQINVLAAIARKLRVEGVLARLRKARTAAELYETFLGDA